MCPSGAGAAWSSPGLSSGPVVTERGWTLTPAAFEQLLARLSADREAAAEEYENIRRKLLDFFEWRGSHHPGAHADETLDRVARKLEVGERIENVRRYAHGVAKLVLLEWERKRQNERAAGREWQAAQVRGRDDRREEYVACLDCCLDRLPAELRTPVVEYYRAEGQSHLVSRKALAERLGLTPGALKTRVYRARLELESCVTDCLRRRGLHQS